MNRIVALVVLLMTCSLAEASPADAFRDVLQRTATSPTRTVTFFNGLAHMEDGQVDGEALQAILRESHSPSEGLLGAFLGGLKRVKKSGDVVTLERDKETTVATGKGMVQLGKRVSLRLHLDSASATHARLTDVKGAKAGYNSITMFPVRWLELSVDANSFTTAKLEVGYKFLLNKTVELVLPKKPPVPGPGMADALQ